MTKKKITKKVKKKPQASGPKPPEKNQDLPKNDHEIPAFKTGVSEKMFEIAYVFKDKLHGDFPIRKSFNAWWLDQAKVTLISNGRKCGMTKPECCSYAGISLDQLDYFLDQHPRFSEYFASVELTPRVMAKLTIADSLNKKEIKTATWYAENKMSDEFKKRAEVEDLTKDPYRNMSDEELRAELEKIECQNDSKS